MAHYDIRLISASYSSEGDGAVVELFGKTRDNITVVARKLFRPYFYILEPDERVLREARDEEEFLSVETCRLWHEGRDRDAIKLTGRYPWKFGGRGNTYRNKYEDLGADVVACDTPFHLRFIYDFDLSSCVRVYGDIEADGDVSSRYSTDVVLNVRKFEEISPFDISLKYFSYDIENSIETGVIYVISCVIKEGDDVEYLDITGSEDEIIEEWIDAVIEHDPEVLVAFNGDRYDLPHIVKRADALDLIELDGERIVSGMNIGRDGSPPSRHGDSWKLNGRIVADSWWSAKMELRPKRESLNYLAQSLFGEEKLDVDAKRIDIEWRENRDKVIEYCSKDAELALRILEHIRVLPKASDLANVTRLPLAETYSARTSSLMDSILIREADRRGIAVPHTKHGGRGDKFEGGYVKLPEPGLYNDIMILDVKSMYPSQIIKNNICFTTLSDNGTHVSPHDDTVRFLDADTKMGVLPYLLKKWWKDRDDAKAKMREAGERGDKETAKYYDGLQKSIKILMNSTYGVLGASFYRFTNPDISASITAFSREAIKGLAGSLEDEGLEVVYGDSVARDTEIVVKRDGNIEVVSIETLFQSVDEHVGGKQYHFPNNSIYTPVLREDGRVTWGKIMRIVRRQCKKTMYRIWSTSYDHVDVTEDHSLIGVLPPSVHGPNAFREVSPSDIGTEVKSLVLMREIPNESPEETPLSDKYILMGYLIGNGSWGWSENYCDISMGKDVESVTPLLRVCKRREVFKNHYNADEKGDAKIYGPGLVADMKLTFHDEHGEKTIPISLINQLTDGEIRSLLKGLFSSDGTVVMREGRPIVRFTNTKIGVIRGARHLLWKIGISHSVMVEGKPNSYKNVVSNTYSHHIIIKDIERFKEQVGFIQSRKQSRLEEYTPGGARKNLRGLGYDTGRVTKRERIDYGGYVYDLEVERRGNLPTFFGNGFCLHNTDSVFVKSPTDDFRETLDIGLSLADKYTEGSVALEFEKYLNPWFTHGAKKRYFGKIVWPPVNPLTIIDDGRIFVWSPYKESVVEEFREIPDATWEPDRLYWSFPEEFADDVGAILDEFYEDEDDMYIRGYETRRTDAFELQSESLKRVFALILDRDIDGALDYARRLVRSIRFSSNQPRLFEEDGDDDMDIPVDKLVISRTVKSVTEKNRDEGGVYANPNRMVNVLVARKLLDMGGEFIPGMKVSWIVTDASSTPQEAEPYVTGRLFKHEPDWGYYAKRVASTLARVTEIWGWDEKALLRGRRTEVVGSRSPERDVNQSKQSRLSF